MAGTRWNQRDCTRVGSLGAAHDALYLQGATAIAVNAVNAVHAFTRDCDYWTANDDFSLISSSA